jgi:5-methylcytosine-specific restriction endonuclease McrA
MPCLICRTPIARRGAMKYCSRACYAVSKKGRPSPRRGCRLSASTRGKIADAHRGRKHSLKHRTNISLALRKDIPTRYRFTQNDYEKAWANSVLVPSFHKRGYKRPELSGTKHPLWKGGYERKLYNNARRRALRLGAPGYHTLEQWNALKAKYDYSCLSCARPEPEIKLTRDHIVPLTKGGSDSIENIQPLCQPCNTRKYNKTISFIPCANFNAS